ncbi:MAG: D-glycero-beta-D-manno-heptose 1-phosphate adenylyltransferase [Phycisphaerae bacterium]|nr:D-glycero-beta-D-manno-heptose 1-phosphate adenylyltransferase [Phycisphaerae bacterium]
MPTLLDHLSRWRPFTAIVLGDFMLDQLVYGDAERLSADAPVPVLHVRRTENRAGGAANVCLDLAALQGHVKAFGVIGADSAAAVLRAELERGGIDASGLVEDASRPTTQKQNLIGLAQSRHPQKMFRVDHESREPLSPEVQERLLAAYRDALREADVVCIEDYAKGVCDERLCREAIRAARAAGKPVFVDPARLSNYTRYADASAITPNRTEAESATGLSTCDDGAVHNAEMARRLRDQLDLDACILTLDKHGALLLERDGLPIAVPTVARQVYDVTGAGDMFLAGLAAARANGIGWEDATRFANAAAGLEVEIFGVEPIPFERVHHAILAESGGLTGKLRTPEQLCIEVEARRRAGQRIVFTNGCFDILHAGHVHLLDQARAEGDFLIVATNTDEKVREFKGPNRPVNTLEDRVRVLAGLASVDAVVVFGEDTPAPLLERIRPDVLVKGGEYSKDRIVGAAFIESIGGRVVSVPMQPGQSTTKVLERAGDPRAALGTSEKERLRFVQDGSRPVSG